MFLGFFTKYGKLLLEILVVAAIIFIVVFINPGNIFGGGLKLQNTANNVTAIKEIGQLITAEYYGEAIATYDQSVLKLIEEEDISDQANDIFRDMKEYLLDEHLTGLKDKIPTSDTTKEEKTGFFSFKWLPWVSKPKKDFKKKLKEEIKDNTNDSLFYNEPLSPEILGYYFNKKVPKSTDDNSYRNLLWSLFQEVKAKSIELNETAFNEYMLQDLPIKEGKVFSDFHYAIKRKDKEIKKELKTDLAIIGRGWVKAGIDFGELNDQNFVYDKDHNIVHIYGVYPKILDKDINPWFIPEKRIPGFQILESRNANFEHAKVVKQYCIDKLEKMAREAGILEQAERQSKETIKNFIGLLTNTEVKEVHFHNDTITRITNEIFKDKYVNFEEAKLLDSVIPMEVDKIVAINTTQEEWFSRQKLKELKERRLGTIVKELKACYYYKRPIHYNRFSYLTTSIIADSIITSAEIEQIKKQKWSISELLTNKEDDIRKLTHQVWYGDSTLSFISEYNKMLNKIESSVKIVGKSIVDTLMPPEFNLDTISSSKDKYIFVDAYEQGLKYRVIKDTSSIDELNGLKYPINIPSTWQKDFSKEKGYFERKTLKKDTARVSVAELLNKINTYNISKNQISCDTVQVIKQQEGNWVLDSNSCSIADPDQKLVVEYILNYYLQESEAFKFFSTSSMKAKKAFNTKKIGNKISNFSDWFSEKTGW